MAFMSYGGFWLSFALYETFDVSKVAPAEHGHATALFLAPWLIFTLFLWIASFKTNVAFVLGPGLLLITIVALVVGQARVSEHWTKIGGRLGPVLAVEIFSVAAAELINQMFGRHVLPLGDLSLGRKSAV